MTKDNAFITSMLRLKMQRERSIANGNTFKIPRTTQNLIISRSCFAEDDKEMYKLELITHVHGYCFAH